MSGNIITSADAQYILTFSALFNTPVQLENWGADRAFQSDALEMIEHRMSVDGKISVAVVPRAINQTITFMNSSSSLDVFEEIAVYQRQTMRAVKLGGEMYLPSAGKKYTFTNGYIVSGNTIPSASSYLEDRSFTIVWERVTVAGV